MEGDALNLTCSVESFHLALITWTKLGSNKNLQDEIKTDLQNDNEKAHLIIPNVTAEHSGQYICTATHLNNSLTEDVNVTVMCKYTVQYLDRKFLVVFFTVKYFLKFEVENNLFKF